MNLNHLNLTVTDAQETASFLEKYFGMTPHPEAKATSAFAMLRDENGMVLTLFRARKGTTFSYPDTFHIGFIQPTHEAVNAINQRLKEDGYEVPEPSSQHGSWTFYFQAPGGFVIEVLG